MAKCYFAKHKLVWEVLDGGLKNKIEIQWSDILALKATYPDDEPGTLDVVVIFISLMQFLDAHTSSLFYAISIIIIYFSNHKILLFAFYSYQDSLFSLGRQIHNLGSIPCGRQHQILLGNKQA